MVKFSTRTYVSSDIRLALPDQIFSFLVVVQQFLDHAPLLHVTTAPLLFVELLEPENIDRNALNASKFTKQFDQQTNKQNHQYLFLKTGTEKSIDSYHTQIKVCESSGIEKTQSGAQPNAALTARIAKF